MPELAQVGDFCPNEECSAYGKAQAEPSIIKFGRNRQGRQRYRCKRCGETFCETSGTLFVNRKTPADEIIICSFRELLFTVPFPSTEQLRPERLPILHAPSNSGFHSGLNIPAKVPLRHKGYLAEVMEG